MKSANPINKLRGLAIALSVALLFIGLAAPARLLGAAPGDGPARWSATNFGRILLPRSEYPLGNASSYQCNNAGQITFAAVKAPSHPTVVSASYYYDQIGQLSSLVNSNSTYGWPNGIVYDAAGNETGVSATVQGATTATSYGYNDAFEVLLPGSPTNPYDGAGNPTTLRGVSNIGYNPGNELSSAGYDHNGNPTTYGGKPLVYDADNKLTNYDNGTLTAGYGADGLRAWKANSAGAKTFYLYDGAEPICEMSAAGIGQSTLAALNTFGPSGLIARTTNPGTSPATTYYTFDEAGNVSQRTNASGAVTSTDSYDAFGAGTTPPDPFGFGGQFGYYTDHETGLVLCGQRYYDPGAARWLTRDPLGYAGGVNLYAYCGNNPIGNADPVGLYDLSGILDTGLMGGSVADLGTIMGEADSGCASGLDVAKAGLGVVLNVGLLVMPGGEEVKTLEGVSKAAHALRNAEPIGSALKSDLIHRVATFMRDEAANSGTHFRIVGRDGITRTLTQIPGEVNGVTGRFEYIVDEAGNLTHQLFVKGGTINGIPIR